MMISIRLFFQAAEIAEHNIRPYFHLCTNLYKAALVVIAWTSLMEEAEVLIDQLQQPQETTDVMSRYVMWHIIKKILCHLLRINNSQRTQQAILCVSD